MNLIAEPDKYEIVITRIFDAPRERVWKAWTDAREIKQWFAPGDMDIPEAEVDLRVGGKYRVVMRDAAQNIRHVAIGLYREIKPPKQLVFSWSWEGDPNRGEMLVTLEFRDLGNRTELVLTHQFIPNEESKKMHTEGWIGCLDKLAKTILR